MVFLGVHGSIDFTPYGESEGRCHAVIVLGRDGVEFVVMATGASHR